MPPGPLALMARRFSLMACSRFQVEGEALPYRLFHSAKEGLLGAGQNRKDWLQEGNGGALCRTGAAFRAGVFHRAGALWAPQRNGTALRGADCHRPA